MPRANYDLPSELLEKAIANRRVIAFQLEKGGVGKTPFTFHFATTLAEAGCKVLCIDLDPQNDLTTTLTRYATNFREPFTREEMSLANTFTVFDDSVTPTPLKVSDNLDLLVGSPLLVGLQGMSNDKMIMMREFVDSAEAAEYDFVFIDSPPTTGNYTTAGALAATHLIFPVKPEDYSEKALRKQMKTYSRLSVYNPRLKILGVLLTDVKKNVVIDDYYVSLIRGQEEDSSDDDRRTGELVFKQTLHSKADYKYSVTHATPLLRYRKTELADEFYWLIVEMLERLVEGDQ
ncbi:MAG: ParA family protein [Porticoccaceae bacterium]